MATKTVDALTERIAQLEEQVDEMEARNGELRLHLNAAQRRVKELEGRWQFAKDALTVRARFDKLGREMIKSMDGWVTELATHEDGMAYFELHEHNLVRSLQARSMALVRALGRFSTQQYIESHVESPPAEEARP